MSNERQKSLKLHLGCGSVHLDGFVNIDLHYNPSVDVVDNVRFLRRFQPQSISEIYACHVLEHFSRWENTVVLERWFELLLSGGILRVCVPDFESVCRYYLEHGDLKPLIGILYGGQDHDWNNHHYCWDFSSLRADLEAIGFIDVELYRWQDTEFAGHDDYSQAYLPHMDKEHGRLMSLNVIARKP